MKHTKILCTIGPSSESETVLKQLIDSGMNGARINTAHGSFDEYARIISRVRQIAPIPIVLDIKGPELRLRCSEELAVHAGTEVEIGFSNHYDYYFSANCMNDLHVEDKVLIADGLIESRIVKKKKDSIVLRFNGNYTLKPNKNVNVAGRRLNLQPLSSKDKQAIAFAIKHQIEFIALSFTRDATDVKRVRKMLGKSNVGIIAKIENHEGVDHIDEITDCVEGVMVARGDLGVELPLQKIPLIQKEIIRKCNEKGVLVITATQMLESMIEHARPTRAEASDVANAILDGTDCVMLSGETATGKHPVKAVQVMTDIAKETENHVPCPISHNHSKNVSDAVTKSIYELTKSIHIDKIVSITDSGYTARMMARFHTDKPIIAVTPNELVKRQLELYFGVRPYQLDVPQVGRVIRTAMKLSQMNVLQKKDMVVFTAGSYSKQPHTSNIFQVHEMSELLYYAQKEHPLDSLKRS